MGPESYHIEITRFPNNTFTASLMNDGVNFNNSSLDHDYDDNGALFYVVAVIALYGCSIFLMIASLIKKRDKDNAVTKYMQDIDKIRRLELRQQKYKTRLAMLQTSKRRGSVQITMVPSHTSGRAQSASPGKRIWSSLYSQPSDSVNVRPCEKTDAAKSLVSHSTTVTLGQNDSVKPITALCTQPMGIEEPLISHGNQKYDSSPASLYSSVSFTSFGEFEFEILKAMPTFCFGCQYLFRA